MTDVTCAILIRGSKVLIAQRSEKMSHPLRWEFPGGKLKSGESPESCVKREIKEELGAEIFVELMLPSVYHDYGLNKIQLIPFICKLKTDKITLKEHKSFAWIEKHEVDNYDLLEADIEVVKRLVQ
ncbi:MAG: (deoxy)nucleoside triphosphate pyrophosphohydrolase [Bacteroidales bacterium]|nr:(deoxy)nucleoside triphosphate pyrophosphohydrolase [Bacteroidales bacterium]